MSRLLKIAFILLLLLQITASAYAISSSSAISIEFDEEGGIPGDIVSLVDGRYLLSNTEYDNNMHGVLVEDPVILLDDMDIDPARSRKLVFSGEAFVRVSNKFGKINKGDIITSSNDAGIGRLADASGVVLGKALESLEVESEDTVGEILVYVDIHQYYSAQSLKTSLLDSLLSGVQSPFLSPESSMRYMLAALIVAGSFILGFSNFGRVSGGSVEALGRNPLASRAIKSAVVFNFILTFVVMAGGLTLAYFILVL